jgi:hypothetical protein
MINLQAQVPAPNGTLIRRRLLLGSALLVGGTLRWISRAQGAARTTADEPPSQSAEQLRTSLHQEVDFNTNSPRIYEALLDSKHCLIQCPLPHGAVAAGNSRLVQIAQGHSLSGCVSSQGQAARAAVADGWLVTLAQRSGNYLKVGKSAISPGGTASSGKPAFFQARRPPLITAARIPFFCNSRATRALVASRTQVQ